MRMTHGAQTIYVTEGDRFIKSAAIGMTSTEEIRWLADNLITQMREWKEEGWTYIADISKMSPATPEISGELIHFHRRLADAGCKAIAFVAFGSFVLTSQAKKHHKQSSVELLEGYFTTEAEAKEWIGRIIA